MKHTTAALREDFDSIAAVLRPLCKVLEVARRLAQLNDPESRAKCADASRTPERIAKWRAAQIFLESRRETGKVFQRQDIIDKTP